MTQFGRMVDDVTGALNGTCGALETHADDLRTVRTKMQQARDVAAAGGLEIKGYEIQEPGPAPANPTPLPTDKPATPQQKQDHAAAVQAQQAFEKKAQAYAQASQIVQEARKKESDSQHVCLRDWGVGWMATWWLWLFVVWPPIVFYFIGRRTGISAGADWFAVKGGPRQHLRADLGQGHRRKRRTRMGP